MTQSIRGRRGRDHAPAALTYVGRLAVEKKPSGRTPSAGAGSKRASGAPLSGGASKLGGRYWNRRRVVTARRGFAARIISARGTARHAHPQHTRADTRH